MALTVETRRSASVIPIRSAPTGPNMYPAAMYPTSSRPTISSAGAARRKT